MKIYTAPLQRYYSEALLTPAQQKRTICCFLLAQVWREIKGRCVI